jgi:hypothetical protein
VRQSRMLRVGSVAGLISLLSIAAPLRGQTVEQPDSVEQEPVACARTVEAGSSMMSDARRSLYRALAITAKAEHSYLFRASSLAQAACIDRLPFLDRWADPAEQSLELLPVRVAVANNSAFAKSSNDGAAWQGAGFNFAATLGLRGRWRFIKASIAPELSFAENQDFAIIRSTTVDRAEVANPYHAGIDYPTRFGFTAFSTVSPGQSYVHAGYRNFSATFGTENLWIGAADVNPILMSYTAPGFPHVRIGTQKPVDIWFARLELQLIMASLTESDYFDSNEENDSRYFTTSLAVLEPKFAPGLFIGAARAYHDVEKATGQSLSFYTSRIIETPFGNLAGGNRPGNAIGLLVARYVMPNSGFEAFAEWSREDTPGDWVDVLREPDWTQAYVIGFQKSFVGSRRFTRFYGELTHLGESAPVRAGRGSHSYYTHFIVQQGHTQKGQLLGAAIGPGSDAQLLGVDVFSASGRSAFRVTRSRYDDDTYYRTFARRWGETRHDAEISLTGSRLQFLGPVALEAEITYSRRYGRNFLPLAIEGDDLVENNWLTRIVAEWRPSW